MTIAQDIGMFQPSNCDDILFSHSVLGQVILLLDSSHPFKLSLAAPSGRVSFNRDHSRRFETTSDPFCLMAPSRLRLLPQVWQWLWWGPS